MHSLRATALCAALSLLAPAAASAGVGAHLQWAGHHAGQVHEAGGHAHPHPHPHEAAAPAEEEPEDLSGAGLARPGSHSHEAPAVGIAPATLREKGDVTGGPRHGSDRPIAIGPAGGVPGDSGADRSRPPDPGPGPRSTPPLIHLNCALLL